MIVGVASHNVLKSYLICILLSTTLFLIIMILVVLLVLGLALCLAVGPVLDRLHVLKLLDNSRQEGRAAAADLNRGTAQEKPVESEQGAVTDLVTDPLVDATLPAWAQTKSLRRPWQRSRD